MTSRNTPTLRSAMNAEPGRRVGKFKAKPMTKARRGKEKDDFDWRADPVKPGSTTSLLSGYKSVKHRWACKYKEQQQRQHMAAANGSQEWDTLGLHNPFERVAISAAHPNGQAPQPEPSNQAAEPNSPEISELDEDAAKEDLRALEHGGASPTKKEGVLPKWGRSNAISKGKRMNSIKDREEAVRIAAKEQQRQADEELKSEREEHARQVTAASLANDSLQENVRKVEKQAEHELAQAAEHDRGAQAASSLRRELHSRDGPDPLEELNSQVPGDDKARTAAYLERPGSGNRRVQSKAQAKAGRQRQAEQKRRAGSTADRGNSHSPAEDMAETHGASRKTRAQGESISPIASSKGQPQSPHAVNGMSMAEDGSLLTQVMFVDGEEREHLGELDLQQLDSFKDLWRTMRAAYARLPKGNLKLVYKDLDNDLMQLQDEPWPYFKSNARGLFLMRAKTTRTS